MTTGFFNMPASEYHSDPAHQPSLSSSLAKVLLNQTPRHAWLAHPRLNPDYESSSDPKFDLGSAAHEIILGKGGGFTVLNFDDYRTKAAQEARKEAYDAGRTPLLAEQHTRAEKMARAVIDRVRQIDGLEQAFKPGVGMYETVAIWEDAGGPTCRCQIDFWGPDETTLVDIKTTSVGLSNGSLARQIANLSYDLSAGFYMRGVRTLRPELAGRMRWLWVFVEADEPHEVRVVQADNTALTIGERKAAVAIEVWRQCMETGIWPGYAPKIETIDYPAFAENQWIEREMIDPAAQKASFYGRTVERPAPALIFGGG